MNPKKLDTAFVLSGILFLVTMSLDFYITNSASKGDFALEANVVGRLFWELLDSFRYIEIPIWIATAFGVAYVINLRSRFLALLWLNVIACNHFLGFLTWLPTDSVFNILYATIKVAWLLPYTLALVSIAVCLPLTFLQTKVIKRHKS